MVILDIIQNVKQSGFRERKSIKILGAPLFLKIVIDFVLPQIQEMSDESFNFALDSYHIGNLNGSQYQFDSYSVIQIFTKHLEYLDLDDWIVCSSVDSIKLPACIYGNRNLIKEMHNNPQRIIDAPRHHYFYHHSCLNLRRIFTKNPLPTLCR